MAIPDDELEVLGFVSPDELELLDEELEEVELEDELELDEEELDEEELDEDMNCSRV